MHVLLLDCCFFLFLIFPCTKSAHQDSTFKPTDVLLINCGSDGNASDSDGRPWQGDAAFVSSSANSSAATTRMPEVPFTTARIFTGLVTYSINVTARERKFVRLYFYPSVYGGRNASAAVFHVQIGDHKLVWDFNPESEVEALKNKPSIAHGYTSLMVIMREYSLNVSDSGFVNLTFTPSSSYPSSYAFVNGIEIVSMPDIFTSMGHLYVVGSSDTYFNITPTTDLETMHRLNVGGMSVTRNADSGLYRQWSNDEPYIVPGPRHGLTHRIDPDITLKYPYATPRYIAPQEVYETVRTMTGTASINAQINLTWSFTVDPGFYYLVRLHFCDVQGLYNKPNQIVFSIFINNETAEEQADVYSWATILVGNVQQGSALGVPFYKDYATYLPSGPGKVDLWLSLHPNADTKPEFPDVRLNGIEVFKLNNENNLASPGPAIAGDTLANHHISVSAVIAGVVGGIVLVAGLTILFLVLRRKKRQRIMKANTQQGPANNQMGSTLSSNACHRFTFTQIQDATQGFSETLVIGVGGFGKVYKGLIRPSKSMPTSKEKIEVAIKRAHPTSQQGIQEFMNEVEMLSKLRHRHLVALFGFCDDRGEMILVYEYLANGTLREHLNDSSMKPTLSWQQRLQICIDAARGLHYLHTGIQHTIIHRDVKSTNILLDDAWVAKVADFGLCKVGPEMDRRNIVLSTAVKGSFGYLDPDYFRRQKLTDKSDVYSFGVVLFEVICSRPAVDVNLPHEQVSLVEWARYCYDNGLLETIVDQNLKKQITSDCFAKFIDTAIKCTSESGINRPTMGDVLWSLESAMQPQDDSEKKQDSSTTCSNLMGHTSMGYDDFTSSDVLFSEIVDPRGR